MLLRNKNFLYNTVYRLNCLSNHSTHICSKLIRPSSFSRPMMSAIPQNQLPTVPKSFMNEFGKNLKSSIESDIETLVNSNIIDDEARDNLFRRVNSFSAAYVTSCLTASMQTRAINKRTNSIQFCLRTGNFADIQNMLSANKTAIDEVLAGLAAPHLREANLGITIERFTENRLLFNFFMTGQLADLAEMQPCNDEEYLGSVLGFAQELARYALSRGCEADTVSIDICKRLLQEVNGKMLEFSFRNSPLRRKYDTLKYSLRNVENIEFDLSMVSPAVAVFDDCAAPAAKKLRTDVNENATAGECDRNIDGTHIATITSIVVSPSMLNKTCFDEIRTRYDIVDALREEVIKQCRNVQKSAKLGIFSIQRGDLVDASAKLNSGEIGIKKILSSIEQYPGLRNGALSNCIEEWGEGYLLLQWVQSKQLVSNASMPIKMTCFEYVGALSDFTGEIGRLAVTAASKRDKKSVLEILQVDLVVCTFANQLNVSGQFYKKCEAIATNMKKVEELLYELSLQEFGGRGKRLREEEPQGSSNNNNNNDEDAGET